MEVLFMAAEKSEVIELGLTRTDSTGEVRTAILVLKTDKDLRGGLKSSATVFWEGFHSRQHAFGLGRGGDYSKTLLQSPGIRATQKAIATQHAQVFTDELRADLTTESRQWYADGKDKR
jgi:hypothetical protein